MKFSELDKSKLSLEEKYELVMHGIKDYAKDEANKEDKVDFLIVLGCRPVPLKARIIKAAELYKKKYAKYVLFSGGPAWNNKVEKGSDKDLEMIESIRQIVKPELLGENQNEKVRKIEEKFNQMLGRKPKSVEDKIRDLSECQLMSRMMITLGDVPAGNIFHEPFSNNTIENIKYTAALFKNIQSTGEVPKINRVMLVTSSFHCRRAMLSFRKYFKNIDICACPSTLDFKEKGLTFSKEDMLKSEYYKKQIENELDAIINYTRNGSIEDCDISDVIDEKMAKQIKEKHEEIEI